ncbi:FAD-dependent monooxygenase [Aeromicrobium alkaliterrae]|uniref:FAD-dependent monooxygenase n=1 Tax=Aeromicrobium alkaliterrae TaxID=302168 RepID=A0ABP4W9I8_9ACTN
MVSSSARRPRVLVTGSSVAGPTAAWALDRSGFDVVLLERSAVPRETGQNIDIRGLGRDVLRQLGVEEQVMASLTGEEGTRFVNGSGRPRAVFPKVEGEDGPTAEVEILRGQLAQILVGIVPDRVDQRFGDFVVGVEQDDDGVDVTFDSGLQERFDLVIVGEGRGSRTRRLVFEDASRRRDHGVTITYGTIDRSPDDGGTWDWYTAAGGRVASIRPDNVGTMRASLSFRSDDRDFESLPVAEQLAALRLRFGGAGWQTERILAGFEAHPEEFYTQRMEQVIVTPWAKGRVALVGDAAWGSGPTGMGTTLALVGAWVLAGELARDLDGGVIEPAAAFRRYEDLLRTYVDSAQGLPPGGAKLLHPRSGLGASALRAVQGVAALKPLRSFAQKHLLTSEKGEPVLPDYPTLVH